MKFGIWKPRERKTDRGAALYKRVHNCVQNWFILCCHSESISECTHSECTKCTDEWRVVKSWGDKPCCNMTPTQALLLRTCYGLTLRTTDADLLMHEIKNTFVWILFENTSKKNSYGTALETQPLNYVWTKKYSILTWSKIFVHTVHNESGYNCKLFKV